MPSASWFQLRSYKGQIGRFRSKGQLDRASKYAAQHNLTDWYLASLAAHGGEGVAAPQLPENQDKSAHEVVEGQLRSGEADTAAAVIGAAAELSGTRAKPAMEQERAGTNTDQRSREVEGVRQEKQAYSEK